MPKLFHDDNGVSVIVGALLLILIVVIAAAGLAMIVAQAEKQQAERQTLQDSVKNENLKIVSIKPAYDASQHLSTISFVVQNLNIQDASILFVSLMDDSGHDTYANSYKYKGKDGITHTHNSGDARLVIPASESVTITLDTTTDFTSTILVTNADPIKIQLVTGYSNFFTGTFKPPIPVANVNVQSENLGQFTRDYLVLDGSDSSSDTGHIVSYEWTIHDMSPIPNFYYPKGKTIRFTPQSAGPFEIQLKVTDDMGLYSETAATDIITIPADQNFDPPTIITVVKDTSTTPNIIKATVTDSNGNPIIGLVVNFLTTFGNVTINPISNSSDSYGVATTTITNGSGTVHVSVGGGGLSKDIAV